ncbi:MAG TPA: OmpA family protein [Polyangiaceae bacterium]|jgi:peptidoglycan-associated lipoprotein
MRTQRFGPWAAFAVGTLWALPGHAEGFDARIYRPSSDMSGIGTLDGARAPVSGAFVASVASDAQLEPVVLRQGALRTDIVPWRVAVEPALTVGVGSQFALYARVPFVAADRGEDASGAALPGAGLLPPAVGVLVPLFREPRNEGHLSARLELAAPVGTPEQFRGDGSVTGRGTLLWGMNFDRTNLLVSLGGQAAPTRGVGDAQLGNAAFAGVGVRYPRDSDVAAVASVEARIDVTVPDQSSGLVSAGADIRVGDSYFRALAGAGVHDVIGTPSAMFSLAWVWDPHHAEPSAPWPTMEPPPAPPAPAPYVRAEPAADPLPPLPPANVPSRPAMLVARGDADMQLAAIAIPPVLFATSSAALDGDAVRGLAVFAARIQALTVPVAVRLIGHADRRGAAPSNQDLGARRARAVARFLSDLGIAPAAIQEQSVGAEQPARGEALSEADLLRDRRVEIFVVPATLVPQTEEIEHASR